MKSSGTLNWGILSAADIAQSRMIPGIQKSSNGTVAAICSRSLEKAQKAAEKFGIPKVYGSYDALLADPDIDAVYCPLPNSLHKEWSIKTAQAGKHMLCEKPFATNAADAVEMMEAAAENHVVIGESLMYRHHPLTIKVMELLQGGAVGKIRLVRALFHSPLDDPNDIRFIKDLGGGALLDLGIYCLTLALFATGEKPDELKATIEINPDTGVEENGAAALRFPSNAMASLAWGFRSQFDCNYEVFGSEGRLVVNRGGMVAWPGEAFTIQLMRGEDTETITVPEADCYQLISEDFVDAIKENRKPLYSIEETIECQKMMDGILGNA